MIKTFLKIATLVLTCGMITTGCTADKENTAPTFSPAPEVQQAETGELVNVRLTLETGETIDMELYPEIAPLSVELFLKGVDSGYYNGKVFHRAISGFMIQGGSQDGSGIGGMDETIKGEFASNGFDNPLKHTRGVVSLARTSAPNSASGQFFIMHADYPSLDGQYAAFGKVTDGMDVVDKIAEMPTGGATGDSLIDKPVIKSIERIEK